MEFKIPIFEFPDFTHEKFKNCKEITVRKVKKDGVAPENFYLTTHLPTFYKYKGEWLFPEHNSLNCVPVLRDEEIVITELRDLKVGDSVVMGRTRDGGEGIYLHREGFPESLYYKPGMSVEKSFSKDYDNLFEHLEYEKQNNGYIVWVLGPSVVFDHDTRVALNSLAENGYIHCVIGGNAMATHDLEGGYLGTSLGQNIYTQENMPQGHYNHLDLLNEVRRAGSIRSFIQSGNVKDGLVKTLVENKIPFTLAGSIRDDGPLPEIFGDTDEALTDVKKHLNKSTMIIGLATLLHNVSTANIASSYRVREDGRVTPVYMYAVDITENILNKIGAAREYMAFKPMVTNVQDFVVNCERALVKSKDEMEVK